jgi:hypothetical protein
VLLACYRFGMGLYSIFVGPPAVPGGDLDAARWASVIVAAGAYLPLLVLVFTPFLPLQDALLQGRRIGFFDGVKHVLERVAPFAINGLVQLALILGPCLVMFGVAAFLAAGLPAEAAVLRPMLFLSTLLPVGLWAALAFFFLSFATPSLILDDVGPFAAIRESVRLVRRSFGGLLGRWQLVGFALFLALIFASLPSSMIAAVSAVSGTRHVGAQIAGTFWTSLVSAATFPFTVSALLILYRALVPARSAAPAGAGASPGPAVAGAPAAPPEPEPPASPYRFE